MSVTSGRKWKRSTAVCLSICLIVTAFWFTYGRPIVFLLMIRRDLRNTPELWVVPRPLPDTPAGLPAGKTLSYFGYEFDSPWTEVGEVKQAKSLAFVYFSEGQMIGIFDPAQLPDLVGMLKQGDGQSSSGRSAVLTERATASNYALRSTILNLTPGDLRISFFRRQMLTNSVLLMMKEVETPSIRDGIFSFETNWFRGFQEGDPARDAMVIIYGYDAEDREIEVWVGSKRGAKNRPTQADVDCVLYSLRPVAASDDK